MAGQVQVLDQLSRPLRDLRVSVTDRCNFRCQYCMPREVFGPGFRFLPRSEVLTFEEVERVVRVLVPLGVSKVRLTGGEPLLRRDLPLLVRQLAAVPGIRDLALTTNGLLLSRMAAQLAEAGLGRVTVSLDSLDPAVFAEMSGVGARLDLVLAGMEAAVRAGLGPVKLNCVVRRGLNDAGLLELAAFARDQGHVLRFIEYMDVGESHGWRLDEVVPSSEVLERIGERWELEPESPTYPGEVASRYRYRDGAGEVGVISSVSQPFCGACTRLRLSADGHLHTCLFSRGGTDLRPTLRGTPGDDQLSELVRGLWRRRTDRYSEERAQGVVGGPPKVEMSYLGG